MTSLWLHISHSSVLSHRRRIFNEPNNSFAISLAIETTAITLSFAKAPFFFLYFHPTQLILPKSSHLSLINDLHFERLRVSTSIQHSCSYQSFAQCFFQERFNLLLSPRLKPSLSKRFSALLFHQKKPVHSLRKLKKVCSLAIISAFLLDFTVF